MGSNLSRATIIFLPSYSLFNASILGATPGLDLPSTPYQLLLLRRRAGDSPILLDLLDVNPNQTMRDPRDPPLRIDSSQSRFVAHDPDTRREEMTSVRVSLEADEVAPQDSIQDGFAAYRSSVSS